MPDRDRHPRFHSQDRNRQRARIGEEDPLRQPSRLFVRPSVPGRSVVRGACVYNDWHRYPVVASKGDGWYDFPIIQAPAVWYVAVLDEADQPISPVGSVDFDVSVACWYRLDWQHAL